MPEWLKSLLASVGGGTVVLVGVFTIFKGLLIKLFESGIESSFEKSFEKFKNKLERSTRAYEILLDREMKFYEELGPINAELVPLSQDLLFYLKPNEALEREIECEHFRTHFKRYCELTLSLKKVVLTHQSYIPQNIYIAFADVVKQMRDDAHYWSDMAKFLFAGEYDKIDYDKGDEVVDKFLMLLSFAEMTVQKRLKELSAED